MNWIKRFKLLILRSLRVLIWIRFWKKILFIPYLKKIELLEEEKDSLEKIIGSIEDTVKERMGMSRYYTIPTYDKYVNSLKRKEANLININKEEIEASVILSDVEDLDSLIKSIKKSMSKNIPELND